jgi:F-type H+-transporting ATPase subunit b
MNRSRRKLFPMIVGSGLLLAWGALPLLAQESSVTQTAETPAGTVYHWLNFALIAGAVAWVMRRSGRAYFRGRARSIGRTIQDAMADRAAAERERREVEGRLVAVDLEIQDMRRAAARETAAEAERIRTLADAEAKRIGQAAKLEMEAATRAARQELRSLAARRATERAAAILRSRMNAAAETALFRSFVGELERSAW